MAWPPEEWEPGEAVRKPPPGLVPPKPAEEAEEALAPQETARSIVRELFETAVLTILIFLAIRVVVQNFRIEGQSMEPTLHAGQYLIVNKAVYWLHPPERGDIIVFEYPKSPDRDFIKRVIGLPGEEVEIRDGAVYINGKRLYEPYIRAPSRRSFGPRVVGPDEYFVRGDNRPNSSDSRTWGMLPRKYIIGKAWLSYWPPETWGFVPNSGYSFASPEE
jgi:signal peptidase I